MVNRSEVIDRMEWMLGPPFTGEFINQAIEAIEVAAAGRGDELIELGRERMTAAEAVESWGLEELVERVRGGEPIRHGPDIDDEPPWPGWPDVKHLDVF